MSRMKAVASLWITALMLLAPVLALIAPLAATVAQAQTGDVSFTVFPTRVVKGQDVLFFVNQTGAFAGGDYVYIQIKNESTWTDSGYQWAPLTNNGAIQNNSVIYLPADYYDTNLYGSMYLNTTAYILFSNTTNGTYNVSVSFTVESMDEIPSVAIITQDGELYDKSPSEILSITYGTSGTPNLTVINAGAVAQVSPGDVITVKYYVPGRDSVRIYWDQYGGQLLAIGPAGYGEVQVLVPDSPEGFHAIIVASDSYEAFNWVYVKPKIIPEFDDVIGFNGTSGTSITLYGRGFPADAQIDSINLYAAGATFSVNATPTTVDENGTFTVTITLQETVNVKGLIGVNVTYASADQDVDLVNGSSFALGSAGPQGNGYDEVPDVIPISTPSDYGDEAVFIKSGSGVSGREFPVEVGSTIEVYVANFPANTDVEIYLGPRMVRTIPTGPDGSGCATVQVPEMPGFDEYANPVYYKVTAKAVDPETGGTLVAVAPITFHIIPSNETIISPEPYNYSGNNYVKPGAYTITVRFKGLAAFAKVEVYENSTLGTFKVEEGIADIADENGSITLTYTVSEQYTGLPTGTPITILANITAPGGVAICTACSLGEYYIIGSASLATGGVQVITPASSTLNYVEWLGEYPVVSPGDFIEVTIEGAVPGASYMLKWNNTEPIELYDTSNNPIGYTVTANAAGDIKVRFYVGNTSKYIAVNNITVVHADGALQGNVTGYFYLIVSTTRSDRYGQARVFVIPSTPLPGSSIELIGVNLEANETVVFGLSSIPSLLGSGTTNDHGAVIARATLPYLPAGTYVVYVERSVTRQLVSNTTIEIARAIEVNGNIESLKESRIVDLGYVYPGEEITARLIGLDRQKQYIIYRSESDSDLGERLGGYVWTSSQAGTLTLKFKVPYDVVIGETYYFHIVPADAQSIDNVVATLKVEIRPPEGYKLVNPPIRSVPYVLPGERITILAENPALSAILAALGNISVYDFAANGSVHAVVKLPDGVNVTVPVDFAVTEEGGEYYLYLSFTVPNVKADEVGVINITLLYEYPPTNETYPVLFGGFKLVAGGGALLATVESNTEIIIAKVDDLTGTVDIIKTTVEDIKARVVDVQNGIAVLDTKLGTVLADLSTLKDMLSDVNATLVAKGDEIIAVINTKAGEIEATLNALADLINGGFAQVNDSLVTIQTQLGEISMNISDLADFVAAASDAILLTITDTADSIVAELGAQIQDSAGTLATLIMEKGDEVIANLTMQIEDLKPLIVSVNDTVIRLETILGEVNASVYELLGGQAEIKDLIVNKTGDVVNAIAVLDTKIGEVNATLLAALDMLETGVVNAHRDIIDRLATLRTTLVTYNSQLAEKIDEAMQAISGVSSAVNAVSGKIDTLQQAVAGVADAVSSLSNDVNALSGKVDSVATTVSDISGKVVQIQSDVADVKTTASDIKNTVDTLPGKIDDVKSSVDNVGGKVDQVSSKLDSVSNQVSTVQSRATVLNGITIVLVVITLILAALGLRRPE